MSQRAKLLLKFETRRTLPLDKRRWPQWLSSAYLGFHQYSHSQRSTHPFHRSYFTLPVPKRLAEVVKLPLFQQESPEVLQKLWFEKFQERSDVAVDIIRKSEWNLLKQNALYYRKKNLYLTTIYSFTESTARNHRHEPFDPISFDFYFSILHSPQFVIPIFKDVLPSLQKGTPKCPSMASYFNLFLQFQEGKLGLMTSVDTFKDNPTKSPPFAILSLFDDLEESKGLIFLRCDAVSKQELDKHDLIYICDYFMAFYSDAKLYGEYVEKFNHRSRDFDYQEFMNLTGPLRTQIYQGARRQIMKISCRGPKEFKPST